MRRSFFSLCSSVWGFLLLCVCSIQLKRQVSQCYVLILVLKKTFFLSTSHPTHLILKTNHLIFLDLLPDIFFHVPVSVFILLRCHSAVKQSSHVDITLHAWQTEVWRWEHVVYYSLAQSLWVSLLPDRLLDYWHISVSAATAHTHRQRTSVLKSMFFSMHF